VVFGPGDGFPDSEEAVGHLEAESVDEVASAVDHIDRARSLAGGLPVHDPGDSLATPEDVAGVVVAVDENAVGIHRGTVEGVRRSLPELGVSHPCGRGPRLGLVGTERLYPVGSVERGGVEGG
jgi:hypothetical protein